MSATASKRPAMAGPAKNPMLSINEAATFVLVSSDGVRANRGSSDACAGRKANAATEVSRPRP